MGQITMIRGTITGCTAIAAGGLRMMYSIVSLVDVQIVECRATSMSGGSVYNGAGGGGIDVNGGTLTMSGGVIRDCEAVDSDGGALSVKLGARVEMNGVAVRGCKAQSGGAILLDIGDLSLVNVNIEDCVAEATGGAVRVQDDDDNGQSVLRASHVLVARCHAFQGGALDATEGTSSWTDSTFMDCTSMAHNVLVQGGTHVFTRVTILRCRALSTGAREDEPNGGGLGIIDGAATMLDSLIDECSAAGSGGCVFTMRGVLTLRNTTLSNCSAPSGPFVRIASDDANTFRSELLTLVPSCESAQSGALITVVGAFTSATPGFTTDSNAPLNVRDLQVTIPLGCASAQFAVLNEGVRLLTCSDGNVCGGAATCSDVQMHAIEPSMATVHCSCQGEYFPSPTATSAALAPYGSDPNIDYCVRPSTLLYDYRHRPIYHTRVNPDPRCCAGHTAYGDSGRSRRLCFGESAPPFQDVVGQCCVYTRVAH